MIDGIYPPVKLSPAERENIAFSAFPDSFQFDQGSQNHSFRIREELKDLANRRCPLSVDGFIYGFAHFTQRRDPTSKRGYYQSSIVILTYHPYPALFSALASILGPLFQSHEIPMLESACYNIATWKAGPNSRRDSGAWLPWYGFTRRDSTFSGHSTTDGDIFI